MQQMPIRQIVSLLLCVCGCFIVTAQTEASLVASGKFSANSFPLFTSSAVPSICIDSNDTKVVTIAATAFASDIQLLSGKNMSVQNHVPFVSNNIIAGTIGHSKFIDELIRSKKINVADIQSNWERFKIVIIGRIGKQQLVVAGSDRRGTAFGIFYLSRLMGISPFVWWADVAPKKIDQLFISGSYISATPSVQYRGIFINDEDWGLQPWAAKKMDTVINDIGPNTYAKIFELLLRLKANYIWPAMHPCTKAFYYYKQNPHVADDYAIIVGGSHCEPMLRNNVFEWAENYEQEYGKKPGEWRYDVNKNDIYNYWNDRVKEAVNFESVYTVGMRGVHDGSMPGPKDPNEKMKLLENVIIDQRKILNNNFNRAASGIPQIFVPYKEVLGLYRMGMALPDDITIIWPDDNHGYIRQLPNAAEQKRSGGNGVYFHLSYWGSPQDYLWLSSISPSLIGYEMNKAYLYGAKKLWVFNVGDIKPAELEIQYALDMAYDIGNAAPDKAYAYTKWWAEEIFGKELSAEIAAIKNEYYLLAQSGKPEHINNISFSFTQINDRLKKYEVIAAKAMQLKSIVPATLQDAYFELVLYPVLCAKLMNEKWLCAKNSFNRANTSIQKSYNAKSVKIAYDSIRLLTALYNNDIAAGKWNGMMSWHPRDQEVFKMPMIADAAFTFKTDSLENLYDQIKNPTIILPASSFSLKKAGADATVQILQGLGIDGKGLSVLNTNSFNNTFTDEIYVEYELQKLDTGKYLIVVKCLPPFDVNTSKNLRYAIAVNNDAATTINVHAEADSRQWKENVLRGYSSGTSIHTISTSNIKLRIYFKNANLVINAIEFYKQ